MRRNANFILRNICEENILVPIGPQVKQMNGFVRLNETGAFIWNLLNDNQEIEEIVEAIAVKYKVDIQRARTGVKTFLNQIQQMGIIDV